MSSKMASLCNYGKQRGKVQGDVLFSDQPSSVVRASVMRNRLFCPSTVISTSEFKRNIGNTFYSSGLIVLTVYCHSFPHILLIPFLSREHVTMVELNVLNGYTIM